MPIPRFSSRQPLCFVTVLLLLFYSTTDALSPRANNVSKKGVSKLPQRDNTQTSSSAIQQTSMIYYEPAPVNKYSRYNTYNNNKSSSNIYNINTIDRRGLFAAVAAAAVAVTVASKTATSNVIAKIPLYWTPQLNAYIIYFYIGNERYGGILDTGSPFVMIPDTCSQKWGCRQRSQPFIQDTANIQDTIERFNYGDGVVKWRQAPISFDGPTSTKNNAMSLAFTKNKSIPSLFTLGIADDSLLKGPGGIFFGLVRDTDDWIQPPSFLSQFSNVQSFVIDMSKPGQESLSLLKSTPTTASSNTRKKQNAIPLVPDLKQTFSFPVMHYTVKAESLTINGRPFESDRPIYVIIDTGVSGMVVTTELFDMHYNTARQKRDKKLWGNVQIGLQQSNDSNSIQYISAQNPITTQQAMFWPKGTTPAHVIVMGLSFLTGHCLTIDMDEKQVWIE